MKSLREIQRAIRELTPQDRAELYAWLDTRRSNSTKIDTPTVIEQRLGLFGGAEDAALMDEVVGLAYEERRRSSAAS